MKPTENHAKTLIGPEGAGLWVNPSADGLVRLALRRLPQVEIRPLTDYSRQAPSVPGAEHVPHPSLGSELARGHLGIAVIAASKLA